MSRRGNFSFCEGFRMTAIPRMRLAPGRRPKASKERTRAHDLLRFYAGEGGDLGGGS
jgi:hypothetical protein